MATRIEQLLARGAAMTAEPLKPIGCPIEEVQVDTMKCKQYGRCSNFDDTECSGEDGSTPIACSHFSKIDLTTISTPISTGDPQCRNCGNWIHDEGFFWFEGIWCHNCKDDLMKVYDKV